jgi:hypothetical protein
VFDYMNEAKQRWFWRRRSSRREKMIADWILLVYWSRGQIIYDGIFYLWNDLYHFIPWVLIFYRLFELMTVRPFFALLLTQEKNRLRTTKEWHSITFGCIFMYIYLGLYIQRFFLVIVRTLLFQWVQALTVNYPGLWTRGIFDSKKRKIRI